MFTASGSNGISASRISANVGDGASKADKCGWPGCARQLTPSQNGSLLSVAALHASVACCVSCIISSNTSSIPSSSKIAISSRYASSSVAGSG